MNEGTIRSAIRLIWPFRFWSIVNKYGKNTNLSAVKNLLFDSPLEILSVPTKNGRCQK